VREVTLLPVVAYVLLAVAAPFALLAIPLLYRSPTADPPSLERKGHGRFIRDRLLRLGLPFAVFGLLLAAAGVCVIPHLGKHPGYGLPSMGGPRYRGLVVRLFTRVRGLGFDDGLVGSRPGAVRSR
jgi:hypothetical protein